MGAVASERGPGALLPAGAALLVLLTLAASLKVGIVALALPAAGLIGLALLRRPGLVLGLFCGAVVIFDNDEEGFLPQTARIWDIGFGAPALPEMAIGAVGAAIALDCLRRRELPYVPRGLGLPLLLAAGGLFAGVVTGYAAGVGAQPLYAGTSIMVPLIVMPVLVASMLRTPEATRRAVWIAGALIAVKAVEGMLAVAAGGSVRLVGDPLTYYEATPNWLLVVFVLAIVAGLLRRVDWPRWAVWAAPLATLALLFSFRRSFWIATVIGLALVLVFGLTRVQRRLAVPALAVVVAGGWLLLTSGIASNEASNPIVERAESLTPAKVLANRQDRYRLAERANVVAEIKDSPLLGLGVGVAWRARAEPLPIENEGGREYAHMASLWWWMKFGLIGLAAYAMLLLAGVEAGWKTFRRHFDPRMRAVGLAACAAIAGLAVAELTATFTGADQRFSIVFGSVLGLLGALRSEALAGERGDGAAVEPAEP